MTENGCYVTYAPGLLADVLADLPGGGVPPGLARDEYQVPEPRGGREVAVGRRQSRLGTSATKGAVEWLT